jgi:hypothetical protein
MTRIAIDATSISAAGKGLSRVQRATVRALAALGRHELFAYVAEDVELEVPAARIRRQPAVLWEQVGLRRAAREADVVLTWTERLPLTGGGRFVLWLFELPTERIALNRERGAGAYQRASDLLTERLWRGSLRRAAQVLAGSATTAAQLGDVPVLHPGVDERFSPGPGRDGCYVFHLASSDARDNTATVVEAVRLANERLREPVELVVPATRVSDDELVELYRGASATSTRRSSKASLPAARGDGLRRTGGRLDRVPGGRRRGRPALRSERCARAGRCARPPARRP